MNRLITFVLAAPFALCTAACATDGDDKEPAEMTFQENGAPYAFDHVSVGEVEGLVTFSAQFESSDPLATRVLTVSARPALGEQHFDPTATVHVVTFKYGRGNEQGLATYRVHDGDDCTVTIDEMPASDVGTWRVHFAGQVSRTATDVVAIEDGVLTVAVP